MFYVGNVLWMDRGEGFEDVPNCHNFSGCIRWFTGKLNFFENGNYYSPKDPVTGELMPAMIYPNGKKVWCTKKYWYDEKSWAIEVARKSFLSKIE